MGKAKKQSKNKDIKLQLNEEFIKGIEAMDDKEFYQVIYKGRLQFYGMFMPGIYWKNMFQYLKQ